jgi:hypothetical protein
MGAHDYTITVRKAERSAVKKAWEEAVESDRHESGGGSYAGNATTFNGPVRFVDRKVASRREAADLVLEKHDKWDGPVAVSFYLPAESGKRAQAKAARAKDKLVAAMKKKLEVCQQINAAFASRKSKLVSCKTCGSKLSREHLTRKLRKGGFDHSAGTYCDYPNQPICPLCKISLLSETDQKRIDAHTKKVTEADNAHHAASQPSPSKKLGWVVGGWAAS